MTVQQPGFAQPVTDAQQTFRELLAARSQPGQPRPLPVQVQPVAGLISGCAIACLTLLDRSTQVWLQPGFSPQVREWLLFHTGCRFSDSPQKPTLPLSATPPPCQTYPHFAPVQPPTQSGLPLCSYNCII